MAAISVLVVLLYTTHRNKILAERAQLVMLACAYFDEDGNVMVTNEGALPSQKIARRFALQVSSASPMFPQASDLDRNSMMNLACTILSSIGYGKFLMIGRAWPI